MSSIFIIVQGVTTKTKLKWQGQILTLMILVWLSYLSFFQNSLHNKFLSKTWPYWLDSLYVFSCVSDIYYENLDTKILWKLKKYLVKLKVHPKLKWGCSFKNDFNQLCVVQLSRVTYPRKDCYCVASSNTGILPVSDRYMFFVCYLFEKKKST